MILYLYNKDREPITQIFKVAKFEWNRRLNDIDEATITMNTQNKSITPINFQEFNKVKIHDDKDNFVWWWIINWPSWNKNEVNIELLGFLHLLERKCLYQDYVFTNETVDDILNTVITNINNRWSWYEPQIELDCWITDTLSKEYDKGKTFLSLLKDLALEWYEFDFDGKTLKFKDNIWDDKTTWSNYLKLRYNIKDTRSNNINNYKIEKTAKNIENAILSKSAWDFYSDEDIESMSKFGRIEGQVFSYWDIQKTTEQALQERKNSITELEVTPSEQVEVNIGDVVDVYIDWWNDIHQISTTMKVKSKEFQYWNLNKEIIKLETNKQKTQNLLERFKSMNDEIRDLRNRTI